MSTAGSIRLTGVKRSDVATPIGRANHARPVLTLEARAVAGGTVPTVERLAARRWPGMQQAENSRLSRG